MVGSLILLAAAAAQPAPTSSPGPAFRPTATASAHATARIRILSGVRFGPTYSAVPSSGQRRVATLIEADGQVRSVELLEFQ